MAKAQVFFFFFIPSSRYGRKILGFSECHGGKNLGFHKSYGCKKITSAGEGGRKILAFFFCAKSRFQWENVEFWGISEFHYVRFGTFSISTGVSFGENEISTDARFRDFFGGKIERRGVKKKPPDA